jgi:hypothetical protein
MMWKPSTRDLEIIAEFGNARAPMDRIAAALGIEAADFRAGSSAHGDAGADAI